VDWIGVTGVPEPSWHSISINKVMISLDACKNAAILKDLMQAKGKGVLLFPGATDQPMNYKGNTYPFRQDSSFLYYFGLSQPGLAGIIDADAGESILVGQDADIEDVVWMGPQPSMDERTRWIGSEKHISPDALAGWLHGREVHYLPPYHADRVLFLAQLL